MPAGLLRPKQPPRLFISPSPTRAATLLLPLALLLGSCGGADSEPGYVDTVTNTTATSAAAPKVAPLKVSVFLELSGGMKGFMPVNTAATEPTAFQNKVSLLASRTRSSPAVADAQFALLLKSAPTGTPYAHFRDVVQGQTKEAALGTELPEMLESVLRQPQGPDKVSIVISDFIYGPQNGAKTGQMRDLITDALLPVSKQQLAVAVRAETSAFSGTFYPAVKLPGKQQLALKGTTMPYYIWVVGQPAAVGRYLNEVLPEPGPKTPQAYFGLTFSAVPAVAILTQVPATSPLFQGGGGSVSYAGGGVSKKLDVDGVKQGVEFSIALNLDQLPAAWREPAFLNDNLKATLPGGTVRLLPKSVRRLNAGEAPKLAAYTHVLRLGVTALPKGGATLQIALPAPGVPAWVAQWSTENDNPPGPTPRTYRLTDIMAGLRGAYPQQLPPVFTTDFTLTTSD
ncbi:hypothetical protein D0N36_04375 [Hymenobacter lapidiphilus]|uniref:hypothetical protein n=1 Tax=Hymenobacter sp. CCM 8763 TaxID=2303334 RepID=UPI000E34318A|nr:hypothetical protein [Hymenobacter sp. CCM 8763]RFP66260.1 hypothetical protein D0N36_04375 [Hymenobacter sp. CCM 8763]